MYILSYTHSLFTSLLFLSVIDFSVTDSSKVLITWEVWVLCIIQDLPQLKIFWHNQCNITLTSCGFYFSTGTFIDLFFLSWMFRCCFFIERVIDVSQVLDYLIMVLWQLDVVNMGRFDNKILWPFYFCKSFTLCYFSRRWVYGNFFLDSSHIKSFFLLLEYFLHLHSSIVVIVLPSLVLDTFDSNERPFWQNFGTKVYGVRRSLWESTKSVFTGSDLIYRVLSTRGQDRQC